MALRAHRTLALAAFLIGALCLPSRAQVLQTRLVADSLATPWEILWGPDGWIWMTERGGRISRVDPETGAVRPIATIADVVEVGESGLLGMAVRGDSVYVVYTYHNGDELREKLVRFRYDGATLVEPAILLDSIPATSIHSGSRLVLTPDRRILMSTGDAGSLSAQSHTTANGKILRLNLDGSTPADNPFAGAPRPASLIWTSGHRNPQGLVLAANGILYSSEHGANTDDEINIIERGRNYGWSKVAGYCDQPAESTFCRDSSVVEPITAWTPTIAPAGLDHYDHARIPAWRGSLILTTLKENDVRVLKLSDDGRAIVAQTIYDDAMLTRVRDVCIAPDGRVFVATIDRIVEIAPVPGELELGVPVLEAAQIRAGEPYRVRFSARGATGAGNLFRVSLTGPRGSILLATTTDSGDVTIDGVFPCDARGGDGFRLRLTSTYPQYTVYGAGEPFTFVEARRARITREPQEQVCPGTSITLTGVIGPDIRWSTGDTTERIVVSEPGEYRLFVRDGNCVDTASVLIIYKDTTRVEINWSAAWNMFLATGNYESYRWYRDGVEIPGETTRTLVPPGPGRYWARAMASRGCWGTSNVLEHAPTTAPSDEAGLAHALRVTATSTHVIVELDPSPAAGYDVELADLRGSVFTARRGTHAEPVAIPLETVPSGAYLVRVTSGGQRWVRKIVVE